jgi:hypothetical protein
MKSYKAFLESMKDQSIADGILDKISDKGIESLTKREKEILDNWHNPHYEIPEERVEKPKLGTKQDIINYIKDRLNYDSPIELPNLEKGITYKRYRDQIHIIKYLDGDDVIIVPITKENNWKSDESKSYKVPYEELHVLTLHKINNFLD